VEVVVCGVTGTQSAGPPSCAATNTYPNRHLPFTGGTLPGTVGLPGWQSRPRQALLLGVVVVVEVVVEVVVVPSLSEAPPEPPAPEPDLAPASAPGVVAVRVAAGETAAALLEVVVLVEAVAAVVAV
jgi:hypothetical protein